MKSLAVCCLLFFTFFSARAQNDTLVKTGDTSVYVTDSATFHFQPTHNQNETKVYTIKKGVDIPLTMAGVGWTLYAFTKIYNKDTSTIAQILALNEKNISSINRWAIDKYSEEAFKASNVFFYGAMPLPLVLLFDKSIRKDGVKVGLLYLEAMGITGILYTGSAYIHDKYRPYAYNPEVPMARRKRGGAKNSFFAGHVALVGTSTFFVAKVYSDYHPESKIKWLLYSAAGLATGATGYLRHRAGEHFPTDILIGVGVGTLTGILVPHFHKNKLFKNPNLSITPQLGTNNYGFSLAYRF